MRSNKLRRSITDNLHLIHTNEETHLSRDTEEFFHAAFTLPRIASEHDTSIQVTAEKKKKTNMNVLQTSLLVATHSPNKTSGDTTNKHVTWFNEQPTNIARQLFETMPTSTQGKQPLLQQPTAPQQLTQQQPNQQQQVQQVQQQMVATSQQRQQQLGTQQNLSHQLLLQQQAQQPQQQMVPPTPQQQLQTGKPQALQQLFLPQQQQQQQLLHQHLQQPQNSQLAQWAPSTVTTNMGFNPFQQSQVAAPTSSYNPYPPQPQHHQHNDPKAEILQLLQQVLNNNTTGVSGQNLAQQQLSQPPAWTGLGGTGHAGYQSTTPAISQMSREDKVSQLHDRLLTNALSGNAVTPEQLSLLRVTNANTTVITTTTDGLRSAQDYEKDKKFLRALSGGNEQILSANGGVWGIILSSAHETDKKETIDQNWIKPLEAENPLMQRCFTKSWKQEIAKFQIIPDRLSGNHRKHGLGLFAFLIRSEADLKAQAQQYTHMDNATFVTVCD